MSQASVASVVSLPPLQPALSDIEENIEFTPTEFAPAEVNVEATPEGGYLLRSPLPLEPYEENLGVMLRRWAKETPDRKSWQL